MTLAGLTGDGLSAYGFENEGYTLGSSKNLVHYNSFMKPCTFCKLLAGEAPASIVYRDDLITAFLDIRPVNVGHVLVVPNRHAASLAELDDASARAIFPVAQRVAAGLYATGADNIGVRCEAVNLFLADGEAAGQEVFHVHLHVVPRYARDGIHPVFLEHYYEEGPSRDILDAVAAKIRAGMEKVNTGGAI